MDRRKYTDRSKTITRIHRRSRPASSVTSLKYEDRKEETEAEAEDREKRRSDDHLDMGGVDIYSPDGGWDTDLEVEDLPEAFEFTGKAIYLESCRKQGVVPASYFLRHMQDSNLEMRHHGLGAVGVKPLAVSLVSNTYVTKLDLSDNWLGTEGGTYVCDMLKENCFITHLTLNDNRLGAAFAERFVDVLDQNSTLTHVTLTGNELDDKAAIYLADGIMSTTRVEYMNLSKNHLGEAAGVILGPAISENSSIKHLDLSWNNLRRKGAVAIANGVKHNVLIQKINLSWNGFGKDGAQALGDALKLNSSLQELDISNNRITTEGAVLFGKGLSASENLKVLMMGKNPMQSAGCYAVCAAILKNQGCILERVDFSDVTVNTDYYDIQKRVKEQLPSIKIRTGCDEPPLKPKARIHPMMRLQNYIAKHNLRLVDFFNKFDADGSMSVTREEFAIGIENFCKEAGIKLTQDEINMLLNELDKDGDGEINYSELVLGHQDFTEREKKMATAIMTMKNEDKVWKG